MADEIRRKKTSDPEMDAIHVINQAFEPLDAETCDRILDWAKDRFIEQPKRNIKMMAWAGVKEELDAYKQYAEEYGVDGRKLVHALSHVRSNKRLAPVDTDPDPEGTVREAMERIDG